MHAVVGKHFFEDANHRTAIAMLRTLLRHNGVDIDSWPTNRVKSARDESHNVRQKIPPVTLDNLYEKDELYEVWLQFFADVLRDN